MGEEGVVRQPLEQLSLRVRLLLRGIARGHHEYLEVRHGQSGHGFILLGLRVGRPHDGDDNL